MDCPGNQEAHSPSDNLKHFFRVASGPNYHESALLFQTWKLLGIQSSQQGRETIIVNFLNYFGAPKGQFYSANSNK